MGPIEQDVSPFHDEQLEAPGPGRARVPRPASHAIRTGDAGGLERVEQGVRDRDIRGLVAPAEPDPRPPQRGQIDDDPVAVPVDERGRADLDERHVEAPGPAPDDRERLARGAGDGAIAPLDDRRLLAGDRRDRRAQPVGVVEIDVRDGRDAAIPGVGRVEPAAEAHLHERDVEIGLREMTEHDRRQQLELGRIPETPGDPIGEGQHLGDQARERRRRRRPAHRPRSARDTSRGAAWASGPRGARQPATRCRPTPVRCPSRWSRPRAPHEPPAAARPVPGAGRACGPGRAGCRTAPGPRGLATRPRT